jgi:hypothetical protein
VVPPEQGLGQSFPRNKVNTRNNRLDKPYSLH